MAGWLSLPAAPQQNPGAGRTPSAHFQAQSTAQKPPNNSGNANRQVPRQPNRRMGEWLSNHKNLTPDQQQKLLESDPNFKKLPPQRQTELRERLQKFNSLPPKQRERALERMRYMASLTQEQRQQIRDANQQLQGLPQDRQIMVHKALRHLRQMPPEERQQVLQSNRFRENFSEPEQKILNQLAVINPPEDGNAQK